MDRSVQERLRTADNMEGLLLDQLRGQTRVPDLTFLAEAPPAVLTHVRLLPRVELHVVPQRATVRQQLGAERALHLRQKTGIRGGFCFMNMKIRLLMEEER